MGNRQPHFLHSADSWGASCHFGWAEKRVVRYSVHFYPVEISRKIRQFGDGISGKDSVFHYSALESWQGLLAYRELNAFGPG